MPQASSGRTVNPGMKVNMKAMLGGKSKKKKNVAAMRTQLKSLGKKK